MATITVGISFKNPGKYLELAIKSVFAQTFQDWELILIDDGTTDGSGEFIAKIKDDRVKLISDGANYGLNKRLNQLVNLANAPCFFRMDADDIMHPQRLEIQYDVLRTKSNNTVIGSGAYSIDEKSELIGFRNAPKIKTGFAARHNFIHPTVAAYTSWFKSNPYSEDLFFIRGEDAELWCRTYKYADFFNIPDCLLYYRESSTLKYANYVHTTLSLLNILHSYFRENKRIFLTNQCIVLLKLLIFIISHSFGLPLDRIRYNKLVGVRLLDARNTLKNINNTSMPM